MKGVRQRRPQSASQSHGNKQNFAMMRGTRLFRGGIFMDLALLAVFIILAYVFISRRSSVKSADLSVGKSIKSSDGTSQHLIDARMKKSPDYRSSECRNRKYTVFKHASIVVTFYDYNFHDLKTTISSVLHHTPMDLVKEIIIIDDASTLEYITDKSKDYVKNIEKARLIRNKEHLSVSGSRMVGFKEATSDMVVFLDTNVVVAQGWLEPLLDLLTREPNVIAVPHYDSINDPVSYEYKATVEGLAASMSWSLAVRMTQSTETQPDKAPFLQSPALRGNAMAVNKKQFSELGGYDEGLMEGGGHNLELSLRAWLCGYKVLIAPCSRVGVVNLQDPVKIMSHANIRRISELWFSGRKSLVFRNTGIKDDMGQSEQDSFQKRRRQLDDLKLQCKDIEWFFQNIAGHLPTPSEKAVHYGMMKCRTGRCARVGDDKRLDLGKCNADYYHVPQTRMMFEFTEDNTVISVGSCLTVQQTAYITLEDCITGETKQKWQYKDGKLINDWSQYCLMHVTDPDKSTGGKRQIGMAQECNTAAEAQFVGFDFITM